MDFALRKDHNDVTGMVLRILQLESDYGRLTVLLLKGFIREFISIHYIGL
jgi:hypothetical protein